jgi:hypothetical protein
MKQYNQIFLLLITVFIIIFFLMVSCMAEEYSVFWSIHLTEKEIDNSLDNELTVESMVNDGSTYYIATGGSMWKKSVSAPTEEEWKKISLPQKGAICTGMTLHGGDLYAGFVFTDGTTGLYTTATSNISWQKETDAILDNKQIIKLVVANTTLFVSVMYPSDGDYTFGLYYLNGDYQPSSIMDISSKIIGIIWDGSDYWVVYRNKVFRGADPTSLSEVTSDPLDNSSETRYGGIHYSDYSGNGYYYLSSTKGRIYRSDIDDGTNWHEESEVQKVTDKTVKFTEFAEVNGNILVGTLAFGFYQMTDGTLGSLVHSEKLEGMLSSELDRCHVMRFHVDGDRVFFCTASEGLYSNSYDGTAWTEDWVHE